ncbi:LytTR family DNA-binding domain-containing protein [Paraflavitalea sp. CAU 1676]|uniref:LytR/AlgR family response regulator transcription factor n=1 Tax=Paraflavitalea sp. CAU 1676 TaxID=3032598 RepID=UPI0023DA76C1|nr:LytTR family DNA-binding domain-containing protein [Paraflavitalea sp. CAU 1676]MDF2190398.1 LytTR family DNA-binding domain-containing protein [Paraflavitalea sp. CAU 1676]
MNRYDCLIADDEPIAREIIESYCKHLPHLNVVASCANALEAKAVLEQQKIDILFLDINMPVLDGIAFLKTLKDPPEVIFTTAYKEYAVNAFDLAACDYLLKPFSLDRFIVAVDKAIAQLSRPPLGTSAIADVKEEDYTFIRIDSKIYKVLYNDILYAEANGNYTKIVLKQQTLMPAMTFTAVEQQLPGSRFIRVHRSFIINKAAISHIEGNRIFIGRIEVPIGSNYKEAFLQAIGL